MSGSIGFESELHRGSSFFAYGTIGYSILRIMQFQGSTVYRQRHKRWVVIFKVKTALVVEDTAVNQRLINMLLKKFVCGDPR